MTTPEYRKIFRRSILRLNSLIQTRDETELEISKIRQFIRATVNMLSDDERRRIEPLLTYIDGIDSSGRVGLGDAIRDILAKSPKRCFTVTQMRDALIDAGFDFSRYTSNPLSSISTTLKRFKDNEVEMMEINEVDSYRWIGKKRSGKKKLEQHEIDSIISYLSDRSAENEEGEETENN